MKLFIENRFENKFSLDLWREVNKLSKKIELRVF